LKTGNTGKKLIFFGAVLFLLGLLQGALIPFFLNPRMALSAHLTAVQSGMALMIFGLIWDLLVLKEKWLLVTYYTSIISMYFIWLSITFSAAVGASKALPIAGEGYSSTRFKELAIEIIIYFGSACAMVSGVLIVIGLYCGLKKSNS